MKKESILLTLIMLLGVFVLGDVSFAQPPPPALPDVAQAPIDGGLGILAALGGAYALKKIKSNRK